MIKIVRTGNAILSFQFALGMSLSGYANIFIKYFISIDCIQLLNQSCFYSVAIAASLLASSSF